MGILGRYLNVKGPADLSAAFIRGQSLSLADLIDLQAWLEATVGAVTNVVSMQFKLVVSRDGNNDDAHWEDIMSYRPKTDTTAVVHSVNVVVGDTARVFLQTASALGCPYVAMAVKATGAPTVATDLAVGYFGRGE